MLKLIHERRKSFIGIVGVALVAMIMTGFGLNFAGRRNKTAAIVVNGSEVPVQEFYEKRRELEQRYRSIFGEKFDELAESMNLGERVVENLITQTLLTQEAKKMDLHVGDSEVRSLLVDSGLFRDGFDPDLYRSYLSQTGMTSSQFENKLRLEALGTQLVNLLTDAAYPSLKEVRAAIEFEETEYTVQYLKFDPKTYLPDVKDPGDSKLKEFYEINAAEFETAPAVSYDYLVLDPKDFLDTVEVLPEDIELYYIDHESKFKEPEKIKVRDLQLTFPVEDDPEKLAELKEKAGEVRAKALSGEDFESLVAQYSDDFVSQSRGGDMGWITKGSIDPALEKAAFAVKTGGIAELVSTDKAYHILKVEGYKPPRTKEIEEVKDEIERMIREEEAPGYTSAKGYELLDSWRSGSLSLSELSAQAGLVSGSSAGFLKEGGDPAGLVGLTKQLLKFPTEEKQLVELANKTVLAGIKEYKPADIPPFGEVREKVLEMYRGEKAKELAKSRAEEIIQSLAKGAFETLENAAKAAGLDVQEETGLKRKGAKPGIFSQQDIQDQIFSTFTEGVRPTKVFESGENYYLLEVKSIKKPGAEEVKKKVAQFKRQEKVNSGRVLLSSVVNTLKAESEISVNPDLPYGG